MWLIEIKDINLPATAHPTFPFELKGVIFYLLLKKLALKPEVLKNYRAVSTWL